MLEVVTLAAVVAVALVMAAIETGPNRSRELALVAALAAAAAAGRVVFAAIPNVQPVTMIVAVAGISLGPRAGLATGAGAALASNAFLGQGPWTPWQMLAWGGCGIVGALAAPLIRRRVPLAVLCFVLGFAFSGLMDVWEWYSFYPHTWAALTVQLGRGFWFDASHAIGNAAIALAAGPELRRLLERYARRLRTEIVWA
jgi:energy-coupling factor transport system substrate-specific component